MTTENWILLHEILECKFTFESIVALGQKDHQKQYSVEFPKLGLWIVSWDSKSSHICSSHPPPPTLHNRAPSTFRQFSLVESWPRSALWSHMEAYNPVSLYIIVTYSSIDIWFPVLFSAVDIPSFLSASSYENSSILPSSSAGSFYPPRSGRSILQRQVQQSPRGDWGLCLWNCGFWNLLLLWIPLLSLHSCYWRQNMVIKRTWFRV